MSLILSLKYEDTAHHISKTQLYPPLWNLNFRDFVSMECVGRITLQEIENIATEQTKKALLTYTKVVKAINMGNEQALTLEQEVHDTLYIVECLQSVKYIIATLYKNKYDELFDHLEDIWVEFDIA